MTTYTAIPNGDIDPDSPITTGLMTKLRDNPIAITEGASGAPDIQTSAIASSAVTSGKINAAAVTTAKLDSNAIDTTVLDTSTGSSSGTLSGTSGTNINLDAYSFFPMIYMANADSTDSMLRPSSNEGTNANNPRFRIHNNSATSRAYVVKWRNFD